MHATLSSSLKRLLFLLALIGLATLLIPWLSPYSYEAIDLKAINEPPSSSHWFGTDELGRDLFTRVWMGGRISLLVGIIAAFIDLLIGVTWGACAALSPKWLDNLMMRIVDILYSIPYFLVVVLLIVVLGPGLLPLILALAFNGWFSMARIVRGEILRLKGQEFVLSAYAMGASFGRILVLHLLPNALPSIIITASLTVPSAIFMESFLSFLGLGVAPPQASWGTLAGEGLAALLYYPWRLFFPLGAIGCTVLLLNLTVDALRDMFDPKLQRVE